MAEVVLFHHVQGLTEGVRELAQRLEAGRHVVRTPDLYDGRVGATLQEGFAISSEIGDELLSERVERAVTELGANPVYAGISMGVVQAQRLAQTRPGAAGALLYEACIPLSGEWSFGPWPAGLPAQIHGMDHDEFFAAEGDLDAARDLVDTIGSDLGSLFTYPGSSHLFIDSSLPSYDAGATDLVVQRSIEFLDRVG